MPKQHNNSLFDTPTQSTDLVNKSIRGGVFTVGGQGANFVLNLCSTAVLARLLAPEDFGLIAMVMAIASLVLMLKDSGLSMASIQREQLTHEQASNLFWCSLGLGLLATLIISSISPLIALLYGEPRLTLLTIVLSISFIFSSIAVQPIALLTRNMKFGQLAVYQFSGQFSGAVVAIVMAYIGASYWALAARQIITGLSSCAITWWAVSWKPGLPRKGTGVSKMLKFGGQLTVSNILIYTASRLDQVLIGATLGGAATGLYERAYKLFMFPVQQFNQPFSKVGVPLLSKLQSQPENFRKHYIYAVTTLATFTIPLAVFAFVAAPEIILGILGPKWKASIPVFMGLIPMGLLKSINPANAWLILPLGKGNKQLLIASITSPLTILSVVIGLQWGILGVSVAQSIVFVVMFPFRTLYVLHGTLVKLSDLFNAFYRPALASLFAGCCVFYMKGLIGLFGFHPFYILILEATAFIPIYFGCYTLLPGGFNHLRSVFNKFRYSILTPFLTKITVKST